LTVRDALTARPTTAQIIDFVRVNSPMTIASPVPEASLKPENAMTFTTASERVKTVATLIPASKQVLDDFIELSGFIDTSLRFYVNLAVEQQLLSGDGTGENLHGLIPQATAFNVGLLIPSHGWNKIDIIGTAIKQVTAAKELQPTFIVLHPNDWWDVRLTKDGFGRYILGDPQSGAMTDTGFGVTTPTLTIFGLRVIPTTSIAAGTFLVGSGSPIASEIRDRMEVVVDVSTEHLDFFARNLIMVRGECRLALVTKRPASYISGSLSTSP
jgi:HK97 family phage major capsid protein